ncbi:MAG: glycosyltransferase [Coriobacteriales bacterium]|jgi:glycosyltransferase involved in cell wall biosynthesis|nr:glycosyltransferase [Coriobacteriales bacterium]
MTVVLIAAHNEAKYIGATLAALRDMNMETLAMAEASAGSAEAGVPAGPAECGSIESEALIGNAKAAENAKTAVAARSTQTQAPRIIVIDDASTDNTAEVALANAAELYRLPKNSGKGAALNHGFAELAESIRMDELSDDDLVLLLDADLGESADLAWQLLAPLIRSEADLAIAIMPSPPGAGGFGLVKNLARLAICELGSGFEAQAPLSGQRAMRLGTLRQLMPLAEGYGVEVAMTIKALRANLRVIEVPVNFKHRYTTRNLTGFIHRGKQYLDLKKAIRKLKRA